MKKNYLSAVLILAGFFANAQCSPKICLIDYGYHDDSSPNTDMTAIKAALPDILIDDTPGGYWGGGCLPSQYSPLGINVYSYITSGYEGTKYGTSEDNLTANLARVDAIAADGAAGVFLDEVWNLIGTPLYGGTLADHKAYITSIYNECQAKGLKLILNAGVSSFDAWLMSNGDYLMSDEAYNGTRVPTASESPFVSRILVVAQGITSAANAAAITQGAQSNGFGHSYACNTYTSLPSWLGNYMTLITQTPPASPAIGTITQPTCAVTTGSVVLNGLPASGAWTITVTPGGTVTAGTGASSTITGLASGTYTYTVTNASGCTSAVSANVVINTAAGLPGAPIVGPITQPSCAGAGSVFLYDLPAAGTWTITTTPGGTTAAGTGTGSTITGLTAGTYTFTVTNASGCTSGASANVIITAPAIPATPAITQTGNVLHSDAANGNQWYDQNGLITGAVSQNYTPAINGNYYDIVTLLTCSSDTSNSINITSTGIESSDNNKSISVYPNPAADIVTLNINNANNEVLKLNIYTVTGILLKSETIQQNQRQIYIGDLSCGIYLVEIKSKEWSEQQKLIIQR